MTRQYEQKLARACLAALVRRTAMGMVASFAEIEAEYERPSDLAITVDSDAKCITPLASM